MQNITTEQLKQWKEQDKDFVLLNVLDRDAFESEHIPGSKNLPVHASGFEEAAEKLVGSKKQPVVVYCASAECDASPKAAKKLDEAGFEKVYDYEGGTKAWREADQPVASGSAT